MHGLSVSMDAGETFRLPLSRDFSSELAGDGRPDKKLAESPIADRRFFVCRSAGMRIVTDLPTASSAV